MSTMLPLRRRVTSMSAVLALALAGLVAIGVATAPHAVAAVLPVPAPISQPTASNVTADSLPTVQIDGVVWSQAIVGNTVYAGGDFANARPAGAAPGTSLTPRTNLLAYDVRTGVLIASFAPKLNGKVKTITASPDGSRIYVGGLFTTVNGVNRYRIAAFSTATGALITTFAPALDYTVNTIVATNATVYVGGAFSKVGATARTRLAAFAASTGALLAWHPVADDAVLAMVLTPSGSKIVVGGAFLNVNGSPAYGLAAISTVTGALLPWAAGNTVRDAGIHAAINSLSTDGTAIYGTGYVFGAGGNLEGTFSADPETGTIKWVEDCHGDTYGAYSANGVVYTVSHSHFCGNVGAFPQTEPNWTYQRALAWTSNAVGTVAHNSTGNYFDWYGQPAPSQYNWYPDLTPGTFTGQGQAAWDLTGNGQYVVMGGEFTSVNFTGGQQGLVRFAVKPIAPSHQGPRITGASFVPTAVATSSRSALVSWTSNWDRDDENLTYKVIRNDDAAAPVYTTTGTSQFWNMPSLSFVDSGLTPGATYKYKIYALDPSGNTAQGTDVSLTMPTTDPSPYVTQVLNGAPSDYWRLGEASGTTGVDVTGGRNLVEGSAVGHGAPGAISGDSDTASSFSGSTTSAAGTTAAVSGPSVFTIEAWFKTTSTTGGKIVGFGNASSGNSTSYDRQVYLDNAGHVYFGVYPGAVRTVNSSATYRDGAWHHVAASLSGAGMALFVDGARVASDPATTTAQVYSGQWRVGGDNLSAWPAQPSNNYFTGAVDEVAVYSYALTPSQVLAHYSAATGVADQPPVAAFTSACTDLACSFDASGSSDPDGSLAGYSWNYGDGSTGTGSPSAHNYAASGTYSVTLTVTDNLGMVNSVSHTVAVTGPNQAPVAAFTPTCSGLTCSFDGSASVDPDGSVTGFAWDFGDSTAGTGATPSHTYAAAGTYPVTLTVTDNRGGTNAVAHSVTVAPTSVIAADTFGRTVSNGWGSASTGGAWTVGGVPVANFSVSSAAGRMGIPVAGNLPTAYLNSVVAGDSDSLVDFTLDKVPAGTGSAYVYLGARHSGTSQYRVRAKVLSTGVVQVSLTKVLSGTETVLVTATISGLTFTAGQQLRMRLRVGGTSPVALSGKLWSVGSPEPATWQVTASDATSPLGAGGPGLATYISTTATNLPLLATFANFAVGPITGP